MAEKTAVMGVFATHLLAERALEDLDQNGFDMKKLSIIGRDCHTAEQVIGAYSTGERMKRWGTSGPFWGGACGLLLGPASFVLPGPGPVLAAGPMVAAIAGALERALVVGGLSAVGAALCRLGIPKDSVVEYEAALQSLRFLVLAVGEATEVALARERMRDAKVETHTACTLVAVAH